MACYIISIVNLYLLLCRRPFIVPANPAFHVFPIFIKKARRLCFFDFFTIEFTQNSLLLIELSNFFLVCLDFLLSRSALGCLQFFIMFVFSSLSSTMGLYLLCSLAFIFCQVQARAVFAHFMVRANLHGPVNLKNGHLIARRSQTRKDTLSRTGKRR